MRLGAVAVVLAATILGPTRVLAVPPPPILVDTCGQTLPAKAHGYLAADLDCSGFATALTLGKKATLDLGGFTLTTGSLFGVYCTDGGCAIRNGAFTGATEWGAVAGIKVLVENVTVNTTGVIALALNGKSTLRGSTIDGATAIGVYGSGGRQKTLIENSTVTGQGRFGVWVHKPDLRNSTVAGNGTAAECGIDAPCADLMSPRRPKLRDSTCGTSQTLPENPTPGCLGWCICTND